MTHNRTTRLRETLLSRAPRICLERARILTESFTRHRQDPLIIRRAKAFAEVLQYMTIYIGAEELIVGNQASVPRAAPVFPEFAVEWILHELDHFARRPHKRFLLEEVQKAELRDICLSWRGRTHYDHVSSLISSTLSDVVGEPGTTGYRHPNIDQVLFLDYIQQGDGHIIPNYEMLFAQGLEGVIQRAETARAKLESDDPQYVDRYNFLHSVLIACRGAIRFAERYADHAEGLLADTSDPRRQEELRTIAGTCRRVPAHSPRSFAEAIQFVWFIHLLIHIESNGHSISVGRLDQYLYPYYQRDRAAGQLTPAQAQELIECFFLKCCELNKLYDWATTQITSNQLFQTVTLGGMTVEGRDATNELTYACLRATTATKLFMPSVMVRIHHNTPEKLLLECCRTVLRHGGGMPSFFNDHIAIPMLLMQGTTLEEARDWATMGCSEIRVPGKYATSSTPCYVNLLKPLEQLLLQRDFASYQDLWNAYRERLDHYFQYLPVIESIIARGYIATTPTPFSSAVVDHRIEIGKDISRGGPPNYNSTIIHGHGIPNVANSLAAIKKLVFEEGRVTLSQLRDALRNNWDGPTGQRLRELFRQAPKFGNDDDYVDEIAGQVFRTYGKAVSAHRSSRGGQLAPTAQTITMNVKEGEVVGATPDGRRAGETIADNTSPAPGTDLAGATAVYKSVSKLDHVLMPNGTILNLRFHPTAIEDEDRLWKFARALRTYFILGGFQVQFNTACADVLRDAQQHPERHRNLIVKVAGYSALFTELEREWQDQLIQRTEHMHL